MVQNGATSILVRCSDTDVVIIGISFCHEFKNLGLHELWFLYGVGKNQRYIPAHIIANNLGPQKSQALRGFHAFTGCDTISFFALKSKVKCWKTWEEYPESTSAFQYLSSKDSVKEIPDDIFAQMEAFTVKLYDPKSELLKVNELRKVQFCSGDRQISMCAPTKGSLIEQCRRAAYQAGQIWGRSLIHDEPPPSPEGWGWTLKANRWEPKWSQQPQIWSALRGLEKCGCRGQCDSMRCSCRKAGLPCTPACTICQGACENKQVT